jgi:hypothetical protein
LYFPDVKSPAEKSSAPDTRLALATVVDFVASGRVDGLMVGRRRSGECFKGNEWSFFCVSQFCVSNMGVFPMHSIACFLGLVFLAVFALIAIPIIILVAKLVGFAIIGGVIALIVLGIWKLFDLAEPRYGPY